MNHISVMVVGKEIPWRIYVLLAGSVRSFTILHWAPPRSTNLREAPPITTDLDKYRLIPPINTELLWSSLTSDKLRRAPFSWFEFCQAPQDSSELHRGTSIPIELHWALPGLVMLHQAPFSSSKFCRALPLSTEFCVVLPSTDSSDKLYWYRFGSIELCWALLWAIMLRGAPSSSTKLLRAWPSADEHCRASWSFSPSSA